MTAPTTQVKPDPAPQTPSARPTAPTPRYVCILNGGEHVFGEGLREPLRIRAGWVPDQVIKHLETFVTGGSPTPQGTVLPLPLPTDTHGGVAA